jgi:hypothetical protein
MAAAAGSVSSTASATSAMEREPARPRGKGERQRKEASATTMVGEVRIRCLPLLPNPLPSLIPNPRFFSSSSNPMLLWFSLDRMSFLEFSRPAKRREGRPSDGSGCTRELASVGSAGRATAAADAAAVAGSALPREDGAALVEEVLGEG